MKVLGIDPGLTGALAWVRSDGHLLEVRDLPIAGGELDVAAILADEEIERADAAVIEWPGVMPKNGALTARRTGLILGALSAVLIARHVPQYRVAPGVWKRGMGLTGGKTAKSESRARAGLLWPVHADQFRRVKDDGRAEAALLAWWWLTKGDGAALTRDALTLRGIAL